MAGQLVPGLDDPAHQAAVALRHPAQREEGRLDVGGGEHVEDRRAIALDPVGQPVPMAAVDHAFESADLKPVFDVDRQSVDHPL